MVKTAAFQEPSSCSASNLRSYGRLTFSRADTRAQPPDVTPRLKLHLPALLQLPSLYINIAFPKHSARLLYYTASDPEIHKSTDLSAPP